MLFRIVCLGLGLWGAVAMGQEGGGKLEPISVPEFDARLVPPSSWLSRPTIEKQAGVTVLAYARSFLNEGVTVVMNDFSSSLSGDAANDMQMSLNFIRNLAMSNQAANEFTKPESVVVNGVTFAKIEYDGKLSQAMNGHYVVLFTLRLGALYRIISFSPNERSAQTNASGFAKGFSWLDPQRTRLPGTVEDYQGHVHGFESHLKKLGWTNWPEGKEQSKGAFLAASQRNAAFLTVSLVPEPVEKTTMDEVVEALLPWCVWSKPERGWTFNPLTMPGVDEARGFAGELLYGSTPVNVRGYVVRGGGRIMGVAAWASASFGVRELDGALAAVVPKEIKQFPPLSLFTEQQRRLQASFLTDLALGQYEAGAVSRASKLYEQALESSRHNHATLRAAVVCYERIGGEAEALRCIERYEKDFKDSPEIQGMRARLLAQTGKSEEALKVLRELFAKDLRDEEAAAVYLQELYRNSLFTEAVEFVDSYAKKAPSATVLIWQADTYARAEKYERSMELFEALLSRKPFNAAVAALYASVALSAKKYDVCLEVIDQMKKEGVETAPALRTAGWAHYGKKAYREAKVAFEAARTMAPNDPQTAEALNAASAALGEGDNSAIRTPIEPLTLPEVVSKQVRALAAKYEPAAGESVVRKLAVNHVHYEKNKTYKRTEERVLLVQDAAGVEALSTLEIGFDPLWERLYVNQLEVVEPATGKTVASGKLDDYYVTDAATGAIATLTKALRLPVPGLKAGLELRYKVTFESLSKPEDFVYESRTLAHYYPTAVEAFVVSGDVKEVKAVPGAELAEVAEAAHGAEHLAWVVKNPPTMHPEPLLPPSRKYLPVLEVGAAGKTWQKTGDEYLELIKDSLADEPEIGKLAIELTRGCKTNEEKVEVLSKHVRDEVIYRAIEFGRRARVPNMCQRVLGNRYGDCKDMSLLLHKLLAAVGVTSRLTLVNSSSDVCSELPDLDQFNHMVLYVPALEQKLVDCTMGKAANTQLPPLFFDRQVLLLEKGASKLTKVEAPTKEIMDEVRTERTVSFMADGSASVEEKVTMTGYQGWSMRGFIQSMRPQTRLQALQAYMEERSSWQLERVETENLMDASAEMAMKFYYLLPPQQDVEGRGYVLPALWERKYLQGRYMRERHHPFVVERPLKFSSKVKAVFPARVDVASAEKLGSSGQTEYLTWLTAAKVTGERPSELEVTFSAQTLAGERPAGEYRRMYDEMMKAIAGWDLPLRLQK
ncbi:MAG: tetratricopeptide repeat protein [Verrucomicrobiaceae bacterium]|nr:tetratricopeptide repeat protein [Verrucomicrobiaceae bacterium]